ncbi:MAG TPA: antibiotic ABC transporter permease [Clostridiales bacterium]|nr:antibiotic ABC transporter permease [Clostridiales bacterium]
MERMAHFVVKRRGLVLAAACVLLVLSVLGYIGTRINYDILSYLPSDLESMEGESYLEDDFNIASTAMVTVEGMDTADLLDLKAELEQIDGVSSVFWTSDVVDVTVPKEMLPEEARDMLYGRHDSTMMMVRFDESSASDKTMAAITQIKKALRKGCFLGGMSVILEDTKELTNEELPKYVLCAVGFSLIVLFLFMENTAVPLIFMLGLLFPIVYNFGSNLLLGEISFITQALAAVLQLGVTMDFSIFLLHRYQEEKLNLPNEEAMISAICKTSTAIMSSSLTTIAGFLAMCTMSLRLGFDIGVVMAKGVALGVLSTLTILPALIIYFDRIIEKSRHPVLTPHMGAVTRAITRRPKTILAVFLLIFVIFGRAQGLTKVYYTLTDSLPQTLTGIEGTNKLGEDFDMPSFHFVIVDDKLDTAEMKQLADELDAVDGIKATLCYEKFVGGSVPQTAVPDDVASLFHAGGHRLMMITTEYKPGTDEMNEQVAKMTDIVKRYDNNGILTGEGAMTKDLIVTSDHDFSATSVTSIVAVFLIVLLTFKSISVPTLLVLAIEGAIMINLGIPYFTGSTIPFISSIVIGTIQLGATVDYAILMTTRFREEQNNGLEPLEAATVSVEACAPSIVTSGLTFFAATVGLAFVSKIDLIRSLCLLISRGAVISMIVILLVLPALLVLLAPVIRRTSWHWLENEPDSHKKTNSKERVSVEQQG